MPLNCTDVSGMAYKVRVVLPAGRRGGPLVSDD